MFKKQSLLVETWSVIKTTKGNPTVFSHRAPTYRWDIYGVEVAFWNVCLRSYNSFIGGLLKTSLPIISLNPG